MHTYRDLNGVQGPAPTLLQTRVTAGQAAVAASRIHNSLPYSFRVHTSAS